MCGNEAPAIQREKSGHTPTRKKHGNATRHAFSVRARAAIQDTLSAKMSTLQVEDSISGCIETSDHCLTMIVTPNNNDDDDQCIDDSADDVDYDPVPVATPPPSNHGLKRLERKTANRS